MLSIGSEELKLGEVHTDRCRADLFWYFGNGNATARDRDSEYRDMHNEPFDAKYWRGRAHEALAAAMQLDDRDGRLMLLNMAGNYEQLARRAEVEAPRS
jgi:hypothetical protein